MGRLTDALMGAGNGYRTNIDRPMTNLARGGQNGWAPDLTSWVNNQAYVSRPMHCILLEYPKMFNSMQNPEMWKASLKALFELHAHSIEGFNAELKVDIEGHEVGGAGEKQNEVTNVTREASTPKFTFIEKYGRPIQTMLDIWIRYGLMDPETKFALLGAVTNPSTTGVRDMLADWYSATCLFIVPDPDHRLVDKAWLTTNMFPTSTGQITGKRDLKSGQELLTLDIEFPGMSQVGLGVNKFAQTILDTINITRADPQMRPAFDNLAQGTGAGIHADLAAATNGYKEGAMKVGTDSLAGMTT